MSFICSQALAAAFSAECYSATAASVQSKSTHIANQSSSPDKTTARSRRSRSFQTCAHLTAARGAELLRWWLAGFRANPIPRRLRAATLQTISGRRWDGSWQMSLPGSYLPRTPKNARSTVQQTTSRRWDTPLNAPRFLRRTWVLTTFGNDSGFLHTPTTAANYCAPSMQKWPNCREYRRVFGRADPINHEWMMGWPPGWTDLKPLETAKFRLWQQQHSPCSPQSLHERAEKPAQVAPQEK